MLEVIVTAVVLLDHLLDCQNFKPISHWSSIGIPLFFLSIFKYIIFPRKKTIFRAIKHSKHLQMLLHITQPLRISNFPRRESINEVEELLVCEGIAMVGVGRDFNR